MSIVDNAYVNTTTHFYNYYTKSSPILATSRHSVNPWENRCLLAQGLAVEVVLSVAGTDPLENGHVVAQLLDTLHLLVEELALDEVGHLSAKIRKKRRINGVCGAKGGETYVEVSVLVGHLVQVEQRLVNGLFQVEGGLDGVLAAAPLVLGRLFDVLQHDPPAAVVLKLHEDLGVFQLLARGLAEVLDEARESHIVPFKVEGL